MTLSSSLKLKTLAEITLTCDLENALKKNDLSAVKAVLERFKKEFDKDFNDLEVSLFLGLDVRTPILFSYLECHRSDLQQCKNITKYLLVDKKASPIIANQYAWKLVFDYAVCAPDFTEFLIKECSVDIDTSILITSSTLKFAQHIVATALGNTLDYLMNYSVTSYSYSMVNHHAQKGTSQTAYEAFMANVEKLLELGANIKRALPYILQKYLYHDSKLPVEKKITNRISILVDHTLRNLACTKENSDYLKAILFSLNPESTQLAKKLEAIDSSSPKNFHSLHEFVTSIMSILFNRKPSSSSLRELILPMIDEEMDSIAANTAAEEKIVAIIAQNVILENQIASIATNIKTLQHLLQEHTNQQIQLQEQYKKEISELITKHNTKKTEIAAKNCSDQEQLTEIKGELSAIATCKTTITHLEKELLEINDKLSRVEQSSQVELANQKRLKQIYQESDRELTELNSELKRVIAIKQQNLEQARALQLQINEAEKALASDQTALETTQTELETERKNAAILLQTSDCTQLEAELLQYQQQCALAEQETERFKEQERQQKIKMQSIATEGLMLVTKLETLASNQGKVEVKQVGEQKHAPSASYSPIFNLFPHDQQPSLTRVEEQKISNTAS